MMTVDVPTFTPTPTSTLFVLSSLCLYSIFTFVLLHFAAIVDVDFAVLTKKGSRTLKRIHIDGERDKRQTKKIVEEEKKRLKSEGRGK